MITRSTPAAARRPIWYATSGLPATSTSDFGRPPAASPRRSAFPPARMIASITAAGASTRARPSRRAPRTASAARPIPSYANPCARIAVASRWLRPSITSGFRIVPRSSAHGRSRSSGHSVTTTAASAPRSASAAVSANSTPRSVARASATGSQATTSAPSASRRAVSTRLGASRRSSVSGLNARPSSATRLPRERAEVLLELRDRPAHLQLVHLHHRGDDVEVVPRVAGEQLQEGDVLREAAPAEAESRRAGSASRSAGRAPCRARRPRRRRRRARTRSRSR